MAVKAGESAGCCHREKKNPLSMTSRGIRPPDNGVKWRSSLARVVCVNKWPHVQVHCTTSMRTSNMRGFHCFVKSELDEKLPLLRALYAHKDFLGGT
ncbi:hypothetical protein EVAR_17041_1 [Eumeta japonica]|uniref:Uncharacterized protein n=1 Tax=Eumeta variegata TaxID=151549 RepID=A0A4C1V694_EUMVA|nr:hypothetical protein EVAR_17041_1 [Eumeta japonica]